MEEEDAEAYGFGSFSELFDDRSQSAEVVSTSPLDAAAIKRFWMSETALKRFLESAPSSYEHVAAKFDGVTVDGGLGSAYYAHVDAFSGIVWVQTQRSDSNAQEKRRTELKRLSAGAANETTALSPAALLFHKQEMREIRATVIQNTVPGIHLDLQDGHQVELAFMPGPFAHPNHRNELLKLVTEPSRGDSTPKALAKALPSPQNHKETESPGLPTPSRTRTDVRALIRKYLSLAPTSEEAMELAKYVHDKTGYHLGPTTKTAPRFAGDAEYRKKSMGELSAMLDRMNSDWKQADIDRESHTRTRYKRDEDDFFHYTDAETGEGISAHEYEQRYMRYLRPEPVDPILRLCVSTVFPSTAECPAQEEGPDISSDSVAAVLGFDISKSCLIDHAFIQAVRTELASRTGPSEITECQRVRQETRESFRRHWDAVFPPGPKTKLMALRDANVTAPLEPSPSIGSGLQQSHSSAFIIQQPTDQAVPSSSSAAPAEEGIAMRTKRRRSSQGAETTIAATTTTTTRRKTRRQSIVGVVHFPSTPELNDSDSVAKSSSKTTPLGTQRSPRRPLTQETTSGVCQLCFSDSAVVIMVPCGHRVCDSCWKRLAHIKEADAERSEAAQCPWDRESVTRREGSK